MGATDSLLATAAAQHAPPRSERQLSLELVLNIISFLDPEEDRLTLLCAQRVSSMVYEVATRSLYRNIELDNTRLRKLLTTSYGRHSKPRLSQRVRRALSFVERLVLLMPLQPAVLDLLYSVGRPRTPLLPRAREVVLRDAATYHNWQDIAGPEAPAPANTQLFDTPDICLAGYASLQQLSHLPRAGTRSLTIHGILASTALWQRGVGRVELPAEAGMIRIYEFYIEHFFRDLKVRFAEWESGLPRTVDVMLRQYAEHDGLELRQLPLEDVPKVKCHLLFVADCPPCAVCGGKWLRQKSPNNARWREILVRG